MKYRNDLQEQFSTAYVRAVASAAESFVQGNERAFDADGVDLTLMSRGPGGTTRSPRLDLQVKSASGGVVAGAGFPYDLKVKNYDDLRETELQVPRLLVVVVVPAEVSDWVSQSPEELCLRRCGYWHSLRGAPATENEVTVRLTISTSNVFDVRGVKEIMAQIREGKTP